MILAIHKFPPDSTNPNFLTPKIQDLLDEVHIWTIDLDRTIIHWDEASQMLPEREREKSKLFHFKAIREHYVKGHFLLRILIGKYLGEDFYNQDFQYNEYGKPSLIKKIKQNPFHFNLSNSGRIFVCAFTKDVAVGVDIEKINNLNDISEVVKRFFSRQENKRFNSLPEYLKQSFFFKHWTRKEALLKAIGVGLYYPPDKVDVIADQEDTSEGFIKTIGFNEEDEWTVKDINVLEGFACAIALKGNHPYRVLRLCYIN